MDGASATAWLEMDGEKKPLVMSDLGCADGCGRQMGAARLRDKSGADATTRTQVATSQRQTRQGQTRLCDATTRRRRPNSQRRSVRRDRGRRDYADTSRNVAASDATTRRRRPNSQRRSVRRDRGRRDYANTSRNVAASDATRADAKTRTQVATSQRQTRYAKTPPKLAASQRQMRQRQTRLREDANTSRNVAASDATTRRRRPNSQRRSVRRDYAKTPPKLATSQRHSVAASDATTRRRSQNSQRRSVAAPSQTPTGPAPTLRFPTSFRTSLNLLPQNRCFVGGFRQFSAHLTKCHVCHGICTLSPLDAALPMRFVKNAHYDASKVLRLPRKMTMDTSKVLRLPRKLQRIFRKRRKSNAPATQNDFRHVTKHV